MIGKFLGLPFRIMNAPLRGFENMIAKACGEKRMHEDDRIMSKPLDSIAEAFEEIDK